jgi:FtsZ-binding cell division protein ZapB
MRMSAVMKNMNHAIDGIMKLNTEVQWLKTENERLRKELQEARDRLAAYGEGVR